MCLKKVSCFEKFAISSNLSLISNVYLNTNELTNICYLPDMFPKKEALKYR